MVTFHQQTQRFSVGCTDGLIVLYDLRTATKWKVLEGHTSKFCTYLLLSIGFMPLLYAALLCSPCLVHRTSILSRMRVLVQGRLRNECVVHKGGDLYNSLKTCRGLIGGMDSAKSDI